MEDRVQLLENKIADLEKRSKGLVVNNHIPAAVIIAVVLNIGYGIWQFATLASVVRENTTRVSKLELRADSAQQLSLRVVRLEVLLEQVNSSVKRIEKKIGR